MVINFNLILTLTKKIMAVLLHPLQWTNISHLHVQYILKTHLWTSYVCSLGYERYSLPPPLSYMGEVFCCQHKVVSSIKTVLPERHSTSVPWISNLSLKIVHISISTKGLTGSLSLPHWFHTCYMKSMQVSKEFKLPLSSIPHTAWKCFNIVT